MQDSNQGKGRAPEAYREVTANIIRMERDKLVEIFVLAIG
jgi:cysteine synthase